MRELLETVLAITLSLLGAVALVGGAALAVCAFSFGGCWLLFRRWRARAIKRKP
jgi:hypothetical protein